MSLNAQYILSEGEITRKDNSICFRKHGKNFYIPIENLDELYLLNETSVNTKLLDFLSSNKVTVHFFNYYGNYSGTFYPRNKYISGKVTLQQVKKFMEERKAISKALVKGMARNIHHFLMDRDRGSEIISSKEKQFFVNEIDQMLEKSHTPSEILGVEAMIWNKFYMHFDKLLAEDFDFKKRVRRPPDNPINAMISFGNSLLYAKTISQIYHTHLNQEISFLHEPSESRFSLSLDLCEVFKPMCVFGVILTLINKKQIKLEKHFESSLNYCILNEEGKKIFINEFHKKMETSFRHAKMKRNMTYTTAIKMDGYKLIKYVLEDKEFIPFSSLEQM